jgi:nucleotidyltransferase substrate binding protein (TIGR01987 family)
LRLMTDNLARCIKTLESSLTMLEKADPESTEYEIYRNAVVKGYELSLETSGKLLRKALKQFMGAPGAIDGMPFKEIFRQSLKHGLFQDMETVERWFDYRDNRNDTAHDYGIGFARDTLGLLPHFLEDVRALEKTLGEKLGNA